MSMVLGLLGGCGSGSDEPSDADLELTREQRLEQMRERMRDRPVPVAVTEVERGRVDAYYTTTTSLSAEQEAVVVAKTQGVVKRLDAEEGDRVVEGDPLAQLDTERLELEVARTRTNIESLERSYTRSKQLFQKQMISPDAFDEARFAVEREKATLALQLYELKEATIRAPLDGVITTRHIKLGNTLSPNDPAFEIKQVDTIEAILDVPERELLKLEEGQPARVRVDALGAHEFDGVVERVAPNVDPTSGTFRVTVQLANPQGMLKPGMFARVAIRYDSSDNTLLVARDAVLTQRDQNSVFVVRDGLAMRQAVELGYSMGDEVEILAGLTEGDQVVVTGQGGLRDGAPVRVVTL